MGDAAWRVTLPKGSDPAAVLDALRAMPRVLDAVVTPREALIRFAPGSPPGDPRTAIQGALPRSAEAHRQHVIRTAYDGADLDEVARTVGLSRDEVIRRHADREYEVQLVGFLPGFAYLGPVDPALAIARRSSPRLRVPAGAVSLAAGMTAVYPVASPGGWHLIGTAVGFRAFDPAAGSALQLGDRVRFEPVS
jgi:UPF0271 protein